MVEKKKRKKNTKGSDCLIMRGLVGKNQGCCCLFFCLFVSFFLSFFLAVFLCFVVVVVVTASFNVFYARISRRGQGCCCLFFVFCLFVCLFCFVLLLCMFVVVAVVVWGESDENFVRKKCG